MSVFFGLLVNLLIIVALVFMLLIMAGMAYGAKPEIERFLRFPRLRLELLLYSPQELWGCLYQSSLCGRCRFLNLAPSASLPDSLPPQ